MPRIGGFTDIHSLGLILYELCAIHDFENNKFISTREMSDFNIHGSYSEELSRWIKEMCYFDHFGRPTVEEILSIDWLRNVNQTKRGTIFAQEFIRIDIT